MNVAIDGPAGAGKSTIAKIVAERLKLVYLDTGAMYRAIAYKTLKLGISLFDEDALKQMLNVTNLEIKYVDGSQRVIIDGEDVSDKIRSGEISKAASDVSANRCVRIKMVELQRQIASQTDTVLDGRDIGTYVLPNAEHKFYLVASVDERAKRRYLEMQKKGIDCSLDKVREDIVKRDYNDMNRDFAPLKRADDAIEIDSTFMTIDEVADKMISYITG